MHLKPCAAISSIKCPALTTKCTKRQIRVQLSCGFSFLWLDLGSEMNALHWSIVNIPGELYKNQDSRRPRAPPITAPAGLVMLGGISSGQPIRRLRRGLRPMREQHQSCDLDSEDVNKIKYLEKCSGRNDPYLNIICPQMNLIAEFHIILIQKKIVFWSNKDTFLMS